MTCGKVTEILLNNIKKGQNACKWCTEQAIDPDEAVAVMRTVGLEHPGPLRGSPHGMVMPMPCLRREPQPNLRGYQTWWRLPVLRGARLQAGEPAVVYLITHPEHDATKVGIMNEKANRLAIHKRYGWQVVATVHVTGKTAMAIEDAILMWWRNELGLPAHPRPS